MIEVSREVVAAVNGHAFAAGAFLAMACDFRLMRADRGWICISEIDVGVPIGAPMMGILRAKLPATSAAEAGGEGGHERDYFSSGPT